MSGILKIMKTTFPVEKDTANKFRAAVKKKYGSNYRFVGQVVERMFEDQIKKLNGDKI